MYKQIIFVSNADLSIEKKIKKNIQQFFLTNERGLLQISGLLSPKDLLMHSLNFVGNKANYVETETEIVYKTF